MSFFWEILSNSATAIIGNHEIIREDNNIPAKQVLIEDVHLLCLSQIMQSKEECWHRLISQCCLPRLLMRQICICMAGRYSCDCTSANSSPNGREMRNRYPSHIYHPKLKSSSEYKSISILDYKKKDNVAR